MRRQSGFALIITVSMMVLLSLLAVGLLSLSTVSLRASGRSAAQSVAKSNARMALILAIGQLQKEAGPDTRVTARADILDENINQPRLTGVWDAWQIDPQSPPSSEDYERSAKDEKFRSWLISAGDPASLRDTSHAGRTFDEPVTLWGEGTLGDQSSSGDTVRAEKIQVNEQSGSVAWAVLDEGIKARINTPHDEKAANKADQIAQLGSGERPGVEFIPGLEPLKRSFFEKESSEYASIEKGISSLNFALSGEELAAGTRETLRPLLHDVTTHSVGLLTDTANGGLRQDFQLLSNLEQLPADYASQGVYASLLDLPSNQAPSDPLWETLHEFGRLYRDDISLSGGVPVLKAKAPESWQVVKNEGGSGSTEEAVNIEQPPGVVLMPTIAKVQMIFSLIGRDLYRQTYYGPGPAPDLEESEKSQNMHGPQDGHFRGTKYDYDLHLLYTPVVTLHNPYNVALEFRQLNLTFHHVPFSMQVFRNGRAQSRGLVPFETMFADNDTEGRKKVLGMTIKTERRGRPGSTTVRLLPGETMLFSPYIDSELSYADNFSGGRKFWDIYVNNDSSFSTRNIDAIPGWRGDGIGWDCDWLAGGQAIDGNKANGRWASCLGLAPDDQIHVEFAPLSSKWSGNKFTIKMSAIPTGSRSPVTVNAIEIDYDRSTGLQDTILGRRETLRYPTEGVVLGADLVDHSTRKIKDIVNAKPFAMLSLQAKTSYGGVDESALDGRLATKPWAFAHAVVGASSQKVLQEHRSNHSHEIDIQVLDLGVGTTQAIGIDPLNRGNFITGHSADKGSKFGVMYDIPVTPLQTLAGLNGANPGGSSGYLPRFAQPIGNSWAHPALPSTSLIHPGASGNMLDHSFLLNLALYDRFYFSGLADRVGPLGDGQSSSTLAGNFSAGESLGDPRLIPHNPDGRPVSELEEVVAEDDAYAQIAGWQLMRGAFNINSTSVAAWKAMLASIHDPEALANLIDPTTTETSLEGLEPAADGEARVSRFRLPLSQSVEDGGDYRLSYWLGPREYSDEDLQVLAERIVENVRQRGPFLSLAEFVNRQIGSDDNAQRGALQESIDEADLNRALGEDAEAGFEITAADVMEYEYENPEAATGASYQGAPGFLSQADLLNVLGNAATARSDTFKVRGYGEALDASGNVLAKATCEAVIQRMPEWVDPQDPVETRIGSLQSEANRSFGRRFQIKTFRWLSSAEL